MVYTMVQLTIEQAKKYNRGIAESIGDAIINGTGFGCVAKRACEGCGIINHIGPCMCLPIFKCTECGFDNGADFKRNLDLFANYPVEITEEIRILEDYQI